MTLLFEPDEMKFVEVDFNWDIDFLLNQEGLFYLKDVSKILDVATHRIQKCRLDLLQQGKDPWVVMGVRKIFSHWCVRMKVFRRYCRDQILPLRVAKIPGDWDGNDLIAEGEGIFSLQDVCRIIPMTTHQIRHQAKKLRNPKATMGVWKDPKHKSYLVDVAVFGPWLKRLWKSGFESSARKRNRPSPKADAHV